LKQFLGGNFLAIPALKLVKKPSKMRRKFTFYPSWELEAKTGNLKN